MPTQNLFQQAQSIEIPSPIQSIPIDDIINYSRASLRGVGSGLSHLVDVASDPWNKVIEPTFTLLYDSAVIYAAHAKHNHLAAPDDYVPFYNHVLQNQPVYLKALERMEARINSFKNAGEHFANSNGPHRAEMIAEGVTGILVPGFIFKGIRASAEMASNVQQFGTINKPPLFHNLNPQDVLKTPSKIDLLTPSQVMDTKGRETYLFVYTVNHC